MCRRLQKLQQNYNQIKYVGWATEEEIAARQAEMEHSVRKEVKIVTAQQEGGPSDGGEVNRFSWVAFPINRANKRFLITHKSRG